MSSLDEKSAIEVYDWYLDIERRLSEIVRVLPFVDSSGLNNISSPRLASILLESASLIDSLLRDQMPDKFDRMSSEKKIDKKKQILKIIVFISILNFPFPAPGLYYWLESQS